MSFRPGTSGAKVLWKSNDISDWKINLNRYNQAIELVSSSAKKSQLLKLDKWLNTEHSHRNFRPLTLKEIENILEWKLLRGKDRPMLRGLIKKNKDSDVSRVSEIAFGLMMKKDWFGALKTLAELKGVGPATASAILAPLDIGKDFCPFMADEVLEAVTGKKREYTFKAYQDMQALIMEKVETLNGNVKIIPGESKFTAEDISKALWTAGVLKLFNHEDIIIKNSDEEDSIIEKKSSLSPKAKRRRKV